MSTPVVNDRACAARGRRAGILQTASPDGRHGHVGALPVTTQYVADAQEKITNRLRGTLPDTLGTPLTTRRVRVAEHRRLAGADDAAERQPPPTPRTDTNSIGDSALSCHDAWAPIAWDWRGTDPLSIKRHLDEVVDKPSRSEGAGSATARIRPATLSSRRIRSHPAGDRPLPPGFVRGHACSRHPNGARPLRSASGTRLALSYDSRSVGPPISLRELPIPSAM